MWPIVYLFVSIIHHYCFCNVKLNCFTFREPAAIFTEAYRIAGNRRVLTNLFTDTQLDGRVK